MDLNERLKNIENKLDLLINQNTLLKKEIIELKKQHGTSNLEYLTSKDVMRIMQWSRKTLHNRLNDVSNPIPMTKDGNEWRISPSKFKAWRESVEKITQ